MHRSLLQSETSYQQNCHTGLSPHRVMCVIFLQRVLAPSFPLDPYLLIEPEEDKSQRQSSHMEGWRTQSPVGSREHRP